MRFTRSDTLEWPSDVCDQTKLIIPPENPYYEYANPTETCCLKFDVDRRLLLVIRSEQKNGNDDDDDSRIIDVMNPKDIIGASIDVKLNLENSNSQGNKSDNIERTDRDDNEPATDTLRDTQGLAVLEIFCYPRKDPSMGSYYGSSSSKISLVCGKRKKPPTPQQMIEAIQVQQNSTKHLGHRQAEHRRFSVAPAEDLAQVSKLVQAIRHLAKVDTSTEVIPTNKQNKETITSSNNPPAQEPPHYLILVNPKSGPNQNGQELCETIVQPMLEQAGIDTTVVITTHAQHAQEFVAQHGENDDSEEDLSKFDAIVTIGGDGIIHEVLQGIQDRPDHEKLCKTLKIGVIGAGTGNGLVKSLTHASGEDCTATDSAFLIAKQRTHWMDLSRYHTSSKEYISFLTFSWGMMADIDIESEVLRMLGAFRFDVWAVIRVLTKRIYRARFSYLPADESTLQLPVTMPALSDPVPSNWTTMEEDFIIFWASQVTHAAENTHHSPHSQLRDGMFKILVVRNGVSRYRVARILLGLESATHIDMPGLEIIDCVAYRLEPMTPGSFNDLDGEVIESGPIQGFVLPSAIQTFADP